MRALVYHGPHDIRCDTIADPPAPGPHEAVVRIERTAICGSDLHIYHGHMGGPGAPDGPCFGVGHEAIGEVVEAGRGVRRFRAGDRVLVSGVVGCGECTPCLRGQVTACERGVGGGVFGTNQGLPGAQAEALAVPQADANLCAIPDGIGPEQAVLLTDILPTGHLGAEGAEIAPGDDVAVIGCGPVGLMAIQCAQLFGPARVFALDTVPARLEAARRLGAIACDVSDEGVAQVLEATHGLGPHAVIEAVGARESIQSAVALVRRGGRVSVVGVNLDMDFPFPMALALIKGITFRIGVCPVPRFWPKLLPLVAEGRIRPEFVFTHRLGLGEGPRAYELFAAREDGVLKVLLDPTQ